MSDRMTPIPFSQLMNWIFTQYKEEGTVFGIHKPYRAESRFVRTLFDRKLETPVGPAAGPHTQLAQNIVAAYFSGSRFFELKTVQILDGEDLPVNKPCILADDECYNCEWSTELTVHQAQEEYIKAWFLLHVLAKELGLGSLDGFQFNMSVGYDLEGIKSEKVNTFIDSMMDASAASTFVHCRDYLLEHVSDFAHLTKEDIEAISPCICNSATLSTLHGCPPQEIERIARYLIEEKGLHTFIKCNPTLLGYEFARKTMDDMGYDYVAFGDFHFKDDLQYEDAVPMLRRLMELAAHKGLEFGVKITNTFPVDVKQQELPSEEMYMSGKSLYPLSISLAAKLSGEFDGKLRISYSGGADTFNIQAIVDAGIWPVTVATTLLKPGGYQRMVQLAERTQKEGPVFTSVDTEAVSEIALNAVTDAHHRKAVKPLPVRKTEDEVPLVDCFMAPCKEGCPIHQDIPAYLELAGEGNYLEALKVITEKNPLPFITGTICAHNCMNKCTRNFYEESVQIRSVKLEAAKGGYDGLIKELKPRAPKSKIRAAIVGGGPAGMAAAYFLARDGVSTTLFEQKESLGGVVRHVIPGFRIGDDAIERDAGLLRAMGVEIQLGTRVENIRKLKAEGFDYVILAVGASKPGELKLEAGETKNALEFLQEFKKQHGKVDIGKQVIVIGGGNTAMDTARAAKRTKGVEQVSLVYRRTRRYMPADAEELEMTLDDGVVFRELLAPEKLENGKLVCEVMELTDMDSSGRRGVKGTGERVKIPADTVIAAVGEQVPADFYRENDIHVTAKGKAMVEKTSLETSVEGVFVIGDGLGGPATVVEAIRDASAAAAAILEKSIVSDCREKVQEADIYSRKGVLKEADPEVPESRRCLSCSTICENCVEVCPNRANISIHVDGMERNQIIHVDYMCNECGNCKSFCPYSSAPYQDKFTLFANEKDFKDSQNQGFVVLDPNQVRCKVRYLGEEMEYIPGQNTRIAKSLCQMMDTVVEKYSYLLEICS